MREQPVKSGQKRLTGWFEPPLDGEPAHIYVFDDGENMIVAQAVVQATVNGRFGDVAQWDSLLDDLGFVRISSWRRYHQAMTCKVECAGAAIERP